MNAAIVSYYSNGRFIQIYFNILSLGEAETYEKWAVASFKVLSGEKKSCMMDMRWSAQCRRKLDLHTYVRAPRRKATAVFFSRIVIYILMVEQFFAPWIWSVSLFLEGLMHWKLPCVMFIL